MVTTGDRLPSAELMRIGKDGAETVALDSLIAGQKAIIFAVPGAFTPTCSQAHLPGFIRNMDVLRQKGFSTVICVSVNDPFVMDEWARSSNANDAGITMLADPEGAFTRAIGMEFSAPPIGLIGRSQRYTMVVEDGTITALHLEKVPSSCEIAAAERLLASL